ncbi:MAG: methyl-accepting chemotaxis protein [Sedimenticola sp.]
MPSLITEGKLVFVKPTIAALLLSCMFCITSYFLLVPLVGNLATLLISTIFTIIIVAALSFFWIVAPLQGSLDLVANRLTGNSSTTKGKHGYRDETLRDHKLIGETYAELTQLIDDFQTLAHNLTSNGSQIAIATAEVSHAANTISSNAHQDVEAVTHIADSASRISTIIAESAQSASSAANVALETREASNQGQQAVQGAVEQMQQTNIKAQETAAIIANLERKSDQIEQITMAISGIAEQTNLLALNAAIEAARAGDQGRGFAVVAEEVRNLAKKTANATDEIDNTLSEIGSDVQQAVSTMSSLEREINEGADRTEEVGNQLFRIFQQSEKMQQKVEEIAQGTEQNHSEIDQISSAINSVNHNLLENEQRIRGVAKQSDKLSLMSEGIHSELMKFKVQSVHSVMHVEAMSAAENIQALFEQAVANGEISEAELFDREYQPVPDTDPLKYRTRFDSFTDRTLPDIQEPILARHDNLLFAGAVDTNGYFPTHNRRYSKPLTGDYETDLHNNRTKRIFDDPTGSRCGAHTEPFLLQTYKRDTGEILHDLSVPIYVNGRHWGGFRLGYHAEA